jgi:hypothetical protein
MFIFENKESRLKYNASRIDASSRIYFPWNTDRKWFCCESILHYAFSFLTTDKAVFILSRIGWYAWRNQRVLVRMIGFISISVTHSLSIILKYRQYSAIADLHNLAFTVAHALWFSVSTSLLATDLNTETITSNHYELFLSSNTLYSSVLICTQFSQFKLHSRPCTLNCWTLLDSPLTSVLCYDRRSAGQCVLD